MKAGQKFIVGAGMISLTVGYLMVAGIKETGVYFLTPTELAAKVAVDESFYDVGLKMGADVVPGTIERDVASQTIHFEITDGEQNYPVVYRGLAPDTFSDSVQVVVEGRLMPDGVFHATTLLAKCGSRYEMEAEDPAA